MSEYQQYDADDNEFGKPLPVGAHAPENAEEPVVDPPGMPQAPDDLDREIAEYVHLMHGYTYNSGPYVRPDSATVLDARRGNLSDAKPRSVRETLLTQIALQADGERLAARDWAAGVRAMQEGRDAYEFSKARRLDAEQALRSLDLWTEADDAADEPPPVPPTIPDAHIV